MIAPMIATKAISDRFCRGPENSRGSGSGSWNLRL